MTPTRTCSMAALLERCTVPATLAARGTDMRYWLILDQLGLDVTVSKTNAERQSTTVTVGLGWYGLSF